jgi:hypothetical protein
VADDFVRRRSQGTFGLGKPLHSRASPFKLKSVERLERVAVSESPANKRPGGLPGEESGHRRALVQIVADTQVEQRLADPMPAVVDLHGHRPPRQPEPDSTVASPLAGSRIRDGQPLGEDKAAEGDVGHRRAPGVWQNKHHSGPPGEATPFDLWYATWTG